MKILIADDEDYTREGLIETIPWEDYEIDEIMQAVNGVEADRIAGWFRPDIVLTDIRMPKMDGIQFAAKVLERNPDSRIIFMSGYMEIEYLKSAIRLSAVDYIEKPIDLEVMKKALNKASGEIRETKKSREAAKLHKDIWQRKLFYLLTDKDADPKTVEKLSKETKFPLNLSYVCLKIQLAADGGVEPEQRVCSLEQFFTFPGGGTLVNYNSEKEEYELIIAFSEKDSYRLTPAYQKFLDAVPYSKIGVGIETPGIRGIYNSFRTATAAMNCSFYQEDQRLFQIDEDILQRSVVDPGIYGEFLQVLPEGPIRLQQWFDRLFDNLMEKKYYHKEQIYILILSLLTEVFRHYPELYGVAGRITKDEQIREYLLQLKTLGAIRRFEENLMGELSVKQEERSAYGRVTRGVLEEIAKHYREEDLSVSIIAERLHLTPAYLNVLFKQEMKVTLKQYLSSYRLGMAKKMLEQGYEKITEIAESCGYANANYFAKVFRESTGMTPAEYRREKCGK